MLTLYNVISSDGFIAGKDGNEDFIPNNLWQNFLAICREYGTVIIGRKSYDSIQSYGKEQLQEFEALPIRKIIVTHNQKFIPKQNYIVAHSPEDAFALAQDALVSSGPILNDYLLQKDFVKKIILHQVPVSIHEGIRPFNGDSVNLVSIKEVPELDGVKVIEYSVSVIV